jgi:signal transduction histidine kinase
MGHPSLPSAGPRRDRTVVPNGRLVLLAVLPAVLVALIGAGAGAVLASLGRLSGVAESTAWTLLGIAALLTAAVIGGAGFAAARHSALHATARDAACHDERAAELGRFALRGHAELAGLLRQVAAGRPMVRRRDGQGAGPPPPPGLGPLAEEIAAAQRSAEAAVLELAATAGRGGGGESDGSTERFEVFDNLARRLQSLVHREIGLLDELEKQVEDPDLLKGLFQVDHLATRVRRYAENLALLGGAVAHRQWTRPISVSDVMRAAAAEIEQYWRVKLVPPIEGTVRGHAVADVVHLIAELAENATAFSPPQTRVQLSAQRVTAGLAIEVEDRGLGVSGAERAELNALLAAPERVALGELLADGRIGLYVVSSLARRHGAAVELKGNIYGGTQAVLVLPQEVLGEERPSGKVRERATSGHHDSQPAAALAAPVAETPAETPATHGYAGEPGDIPDSVSAARTFPGEAHADPPPAGTPPPLPKRHRQEHLAPELRDSASGDPAPAEDVEHTLGLLAAFRDGIRQAEEAPETGASPP